MQPYMTGTITAGSGSKNITGTGTLWSNTIHQGDLLVVNNKIYPVDTIKDNTHLTIFTPTQEALTNASYFIARTDSNWGSNADIAAKVTETMDLYKNKLLAGTTFTSFSIPKTAWVSYSDSDYETSFRASVSVSGAIADQLVEFYLDKLSYKDAAVSGIVADIQSSNTVYFYAKTKPANAISGKLKIL